MKLRWLVRHELLQGIADEEKVLQFFNELTSDWEDIPTEKEEVKEND